MNEQQANVQTSWDRLLEVLQGQGALQTLDALAPGLADDHLTKEFSGVDGLDALMHGQIRQLFGCVNGFQEGQWAQLLPGVDLLSVQRMIETREMMLEVAPAPAEYPAEAGTPVYGFIPEFIPFAERDGYLLVADVREGAARGVIISYDKVDADDEAETWNSLSQYLTELAYALQTRSVFASSIPAINDGQLQWT